MKLNRGVLIFGGVIVGAVVIIAGVVWFTSLFRTPGVGETVPPNIFSSLFPFGQGDQKTGAASDIESENEGSFGSVPALREVSSAPVAGAHFQNNGALRFVQRETGHFFETAADSLVVTRISHTTIPGVQRIAWLGDTAFVLQYLDESDSIRNFFASLASSTPDQALLGTFIGDFTYVVPMLDGKRAVLGTRLGNGIRVELFDAEAGTSKLLFASAIRSWVPLSGGTDVFLETAPSEYPGFLYKIGANQALEKIAGGLPGLMAVPRPSGEYVALSSTETGTSRLFVMHMESGASYLSPVATLAEKCAWFPTSEPLLFCGIPDSFAGISLDGWFEGSQSFSDSAWIIDPIKGTAKIISTLEEDAGRPIDMIEPSVSPDGAYAMFVNKNDLSLWSLSLE